MVCKTSLTFFLRPDRRRPQSGDELAEGSGRPLTRDDRVAQAVPREGLPRGRQQWSHVQIPVR